MLKLRSSGGRGRGVVLAGQKEPNLPADSLTSSPESDVHPACGKAGLHVAIIMDGNGRWAKQRHKPRAFGHHAGVLALRRTIEAAIFLGISHLTVFAFSTENWRRPKSEISDLFGLLRAFVDSDLARLKAEGVRVQFIGQTEGLPDDIACYIDSAARETFANSRLNLQVALNYGAQADILSAVRAVAAEVASGRLEAEALNVETFSGFLSTHALPPLDLLIRTSGEYRLSNFLLWECAYTEFVFQDILWPDYGAEALKAALDIYAARDRRFGAVSAVAP